MIRPFRNCFRNFASIISLKVMNIFYLNYNSRSAGLQGVRIWARFWWRVCPLKYLHNGAGGILGLREAYESCMSLNGEFTTRTPRSTPGYHLLHCVNTSIGTIAPEISPKFSHPGAPLSENYSSNKINL